jgi:uncharacterized protein YndB with AHSA1/START domain
MTLAVRPSALEVFVRREFAAPREVVFAAWTDERLIGRWWAPRTYTTLACSMDVRPGGAWSRRLKAPDGGLISEHGVYREVVAPERLVIACTLDDPHGVARLEELIHVAFEQSGSRTRLLLNSTARGSGTEAAVMLAGMHKGWAQTVDRLSILLNPLRDKEM